MIKEYKITSQRKAQIQSNGKVKRTGDIQYQVAYFTNQWYFKNFDNLFQAKEFVA